MNDSFEIKGLSGKRTLAGSIRVNGAKNDALKALSFSILFRDKVTIKNVPNIEDINRMEELLNKIGVDVKNDRNGSYTAYVTNNFSYNMPRDLTTRFRASIVCAGPILARIGKVSFPHPGGDKIGARPIDLFLEGFCKMGARLEEKKGIYHLSVKGRLHGAEIFLRNQSVTATEALMMAGVLAKGTTIIKNAPVEPEIRNLVNFLNKCGAKIYGAGTSTIKIEGGNLLYAGKKEYITLPDRIETGTFAILAAVLGRDITIKNCVPEHIESLIAILKEYTNLKIFIKKTSIRIIGDKNTKLIANNIKTHEYPGFPTDLQAPMVVLLTQAKGESLVFETIFEARLLYTEKLRQMGADITLCDPHRAIVKGPTNLIGRELSGPDIRAGLALVIAAIIAKGKSVIHNVYTIDRGYENIEDRLSKIGVSINRR